MLDSRIKVGSIVEYKFINENDRQQSRFWYNKKFKVLRITRDGYYADVQALEENPGYWGKGEKLTGLSYHDMKLSREIKPGQHYPEWW